MPRLADRRRETASNSSELYTQHLNPDQPSKPFCHLSIQRFRCQGSTNLDVVIAMKPYLPAGQRQADGNKTPNLARIDWGGLDLPLALWGSPAPRGSFHGQS
jgi:hypothetical protein